jgi:hypothetical protein
MYLYLSIFPSIYTAPPPPITARTRARARALAPGVIEEKQKAIFEANKAAALKREKAAAAGTNSQKLKYSVFL